MSADAWLVVASGCCALCFGALGFRAVALAWAAAALTWAMVLL